jgi:hypothetical protein
MHQPSKQLSLFTLEADNTAYLAIPRRWHKTYRGWRGEFEVIGEGRLIGKSKALYYDISTEVYDAEGNLETVVEITTFLTSDAEAQFRETVNRLENANNFLPITQASPCIDDSLTFEHNPVSESLVSDLLSDDIEFDSPTKNDSLTFEHNPVSESLVSDLLSDDIEFDSPTKNDSLTFEHNPVSESLVSDATSRNDSLTAINIYKPKGKARGEKKYFRYSYKEGGKTKHMHIGGGNIYSVVAQSRAQLVRDAIADGESPQEIKQLIRQFMN